MIRFFFGDQEITDIEEIDISYTTDYETLVVGDKEISTAMSVEGEVHLTLPPTHIKEVYWTVGKAN